MDKFNPFQFSGRIGRLQYFGFAVIWAIIFFVVSLFVGAGSSVDPVTEEVSAGGALTMLTFMVVFFIATLSYGVRRLHDFDKTGWWYLLAFVPFANFVMGLILLFAPGTQGENRYGTR